MKKARTGRYTCPKCRRVVEMFVSPSSAPICTSCGRRMEGPEVMHVPKKGVAS